MSTVLAFILAILRAIPSLVTAWSEAQARRKRDRVAIAEQRKADKDKATDAAIDAP